MKNLIPFFIFTLLTMSLVCNPAFASQLGSLDELQQHRLLLLKAVAGQEHDVSGLRDARDKFAQRDLYWFVIQNEQIVTNYPAPLTPEFGEHLVTRYFRDHNHSLVLIGKDGLVKQQAADLDIDQILAVIDSMPVRRMEANRQKGSNPH
ncbi:DUF4174 domain-containing protein [Bowmanella dokdonensis]|uniref:DUF4174 domain-containing protein n=1 Tax=Bowmanella dokdonensis TaxID=751969 RepID=A0A939IQ28_9ALTE|nr:DUF4174 domain-containing protein [Bowmanella dokdonensis]MBN7824177.1 DUF4174 domain-containing protein [Bowmanella dokdonensis]